MDELLLSDQQKRAKLRELLRNRPHGFKSKLAAYCGVSLRAVQNWTKSDGAWPPPRTELRLWAFVTGRDNLETSDTWDDAISALEQIAQSTPLEVRSQMARQLIKIADQLLDNSIEI